MHPLFWRFVRSALKQIPYELFKCLNIKVFLSSPVEVLFCLCKITPSNMYAYTEKRGVVSEMGKHIEVNLKAH